MPRLLDTNDFRAIRRKLEPQDFAIHSGEADPPASDLIEESVWHSIMTLPSDVSIRTTDYRGSFIEQLYKLVEADVAIGDEDEIYYYIYIDANDEFETVVFNSLHGYYRQAIGALRNTLELTVIGTCLQITQDTNRYNDWRAGNIEVRFGDSCSQLSSNASIQPLESHLEAILAGDCIFKQKDRSQNYPGGWARRLYSELCEYAHSRPGFTNVSMWQSNGPIYVPEAFQVTVEMFLQTRALCYILTKLCRPTFTLPEYASELFELEENSWRKMAHHAHSYLF